MLLWIELLIMQITLAVISWAVEAATNDNLPIPWKHNTKEQNQSFPSQKKEEEK